MERQLTISEIVQGACDALRNAIYICVPGSVVSYDATTQTANIQPMIADPRLDIDTGAVVFEPWQVVQAVPVAWPRFGGFTISGPLAQYDQGILQAFDLDPTPWRAQGRSNKQVNPYDVRRHGGNYWRFIPTDLTGPIQDAATAANAMVIGLDGSASKIVIASGSLAIGLSGAHVSLSGGGHAVARVTDTITITADQILAAALMADLGTGAVTATNALAGTINSGSANVSSG